MEMIKDKITITLIVCSMDLELLARNVTSIRNNFVLNDLHKVILICNEPYRKWAEFEQAVDRLRRDDFVIETHWSNTMWPEQDRYDWFSQQHLKLLVCELVETEWYIISDCKDFYTAKLGLAQFVDENNCSYQPVFSTGYQDPWLGVHGFHYKQYINAYKLLGIDYLDYDMALRNWTSSTTPVHTQTIRDLVDYLRKQFGTLFPFLLLLQINHQDVFTEYALISAWHHKNNIMLDRYCLANNTSKGYLGRMGSNKDLRRKKKDV